MKNQENWKNTLTTLLNSIVSCDNKASALMTAVGVIFGFSLFSIQELSNKTELVKILAYIFGSLYLLAFVTSIIFLVLIVLPRRRNKIEKQNQVDYLFYSEDLYKHCKNGDIEGFVNADIKDDSMLEQIKICARIVHTKENLLIASVISIIIFAVFLIGLVVCLCL